MLAGLEDLILHSQAFVDMDRVRAVIEDGLLVRANLLRFLIAFILPILGVLSLPRPFGKYRSLIW